MNFSKDSIAKVASLARLGLDDDEIASLEKELSGILSYVEKLNELDTSNIKPSSSLFDTKQLLREDSVKKSLENEKVLQNSPENNGSYFVVPRIL